MKLVTTAHAEQRMWFRNISVDDVLRVVKTGKRRDLTNNRVLHYDRKARIGVIINWRDMTIITVMRMSDRTNKALEQIEQLEMAR